MSKANREIECLTRLDELIASYDAILEFLQQEDLLTRQEAIAMRSSSDVAKMINIKLSTLSKTNKIQLLEYAWEVLPVERVKISIVTDRVSKEFSYGY